MNAGGDKLVDAATFHQYVSKAFLKVYTEHNGHGGMVKTKAKTGFLF